MPSFNPADADTLLTSIAAEGGTSEDLVAIANERWIIRRALASARPIWVDGSVTPKIPDGWAYREEDQSLNLFRDRFDFNKIEIPYCQTQLFESRPVTGEVMLRDHAVVLPSHIVDLIEADPTLFQDNWQYMMVFCGTVFRVPVNPREHQLNSNRAIRFVRRRYGKVTVGFRFLDDYFGEPCAMAVPRNLNE